MTQSLERQVAEIARKLQDIASVDVPRATSSAVNKVTAKIKTQVVREVAKKENIPNRIINRKVFVRRSTARTQKARFRVYRSAVSVVSLLSKATVLNRMGTGTNRKGVTARGRKYPGAFINKRRGGAAQVFKRDGSKRYPINAVKIQISDSVDKIAPRIARKIHGDEFLIETKRELNFRLKRRLGTL